jgi:ankyrin repeat protein
MNGSPRCRGLQLKGWICFVICVLLGALTALITAWVVSGARPPLHEAVKHGDLPAVRAAIELGVDVNAVDNELTGLESGEPRVQRETALFIAARDGHAQIVRVLLDAGADPNIICSESGTALTIAAARDNRSEIVQMLLKGGADPLLARPLGWNALQWATIKSDYASFLLLLRATQSDSTPPQVRTETIQAAARRHDDLRHRIMKVLKTAESMEPLADAARNGPLARLQGALSRGADPNQRDAGDGWTALHWAAGYEGDASRVRLLLDSGANPNANTTGGYTPLMAAVQVNCLERARLLLNAGADPNAVDEDKRSALHIAAWRGTAEMIESLLTAGADPMLRNRWTQTPLDIAKARKRNLGQDVTAALTP